MAKTAKKPAKQTKPPKVAKKAPSGKTAPTAKEAARQEAARRLPMSVGSSRAASMMRAGLARPSPAR